MKKIRYIIIEEEVDAYSQTQALTKQVQDLLDVLNDQPSSIHPEPNTNDLTNDKDGK